MWQLRLAQSSWCDRCLTTCLQKIVRKCEERQTVNRDGLPLEVAVRNEKASQRISLLPFNLISRRFPSALFLIKSFSRQLNQNPFSTEDSRLFIYRWSNNSTRSGGGKSGKWKTPLGTFPDRDGKVGGKATQENRNGKLKEARRCRLTRFIIIED